MTTHEGSTEDREALKVDLAVEVLRSSGKLQFAARGTSMIPVIFPGDILAVRHQPIAAAQPGDIVLWSRNARLCAHRVVQCANFEGQTAAVTRGDAVRDADTPVTADEFLGIVYALVRCGKQIDLARPPSTASLVISYLARHSDIVTALVLRCHSLLCFLGSSEQSFPQQEKIDLLEST